MVKTMPTRLEHKPRDNLQSIQLRENREQKKFNASVGMKDFF